MGHRGYIFAKEFFHWENMEVRLLEAYQGLSERD
jgi:hypothetical protein